MSEVGEVGEVGECMSAWVSALVGELKWVAFRTFSTCLQLPHNHKRGGTGFVFEYANRSIYSGGEANRSPRTWLRSSSLRGWDRYLPRCSCSQYLSDTQEGNWSRRPVGTL